MRGLDHSIVPIFQNQYGLATREQIYDLGGTERQIELRLSTQVWIRADRCVYRHSGYPDTWASKLLATCLALDAVASHRSAGALWDLDGVSRTRPEVTIAAHRGRTRDGITIHESLRPPASSQVLRHGIPCTDITRTLFDLAGVVSPYRLQAAVDDARRRKLVSIDQMYAHFVRHARRGRRGSAAMRAFLNASDLEDPVPHSEWSRRVAFALVEAGLPSPRLEHEVSLNDGRRAFIDLAYPAFKVGIELDSVRWHLDRTSFEADRRRRNQLENLGWSILNFTWTDSEQSGHIPSVVKAALGRSRTRAAPDPGEPTSGAHPLETWG